MIIAKDKLLIDKNRIDFCCCFFKIGLKSLIFLESMFEIFRICEVKNLRICEFEKLQGSEFENYFRLS